MRVQLQGSKGYGVFANKFMIRIVANLYHHHGHIHRITLTQTSSTRHSHLTRPSLHCYNQA